MTDPNKAAVTESNAQFLARMKRTATRDRQTGPNTLRYDEIDRLIALAEERVMIEEHQITTIRHQTEYENWWEARVEANGTVLHYGDATSLSAAIRAVVAKIGEGNG